MPLTVVTDTFDRTDNASSLGTATTGEVWTPRLTAPFSPQVTSTLGISSNQAYSTDSANVNIATVPAGTGDVTVEVDVMLPLAPQEGGGVIGRWQSDLEYWEGLIFRTTGGPYRAYLRKFYDGTYSQWSKDVAPSAYATPIRVGLSFRGSLVVLTADGGTVTSVTDGDYSTATEHGIETYISSAVRLDNFEIRPRFLGGPTVGFIGFGTF